MVPRSCCVKRCHRRSHDPEGRKLQHGLTFHRFPAWRRNEGRLVSELTRRRRAAWVEAVGRSDITFGRVGASDTVCSRHFRSGRPAYEMLESDPDWIPSLYLGHSEPRRTLKAPPRSEAVQQADTAGGGRPVEERQQAEERAVRQAQLQLISTNQQPESADRTSSFRDFFTAALEAALQASIRSRAESRIQTSPSSTSFKIPRVEDKVEEETVSSSVSSQRCAECVRLQARVRQLESRVSDLRGDETPPTSERGEEEQEVEEEEVSEWAAPLSPDQESLQDGDGDGASLIWIQET
ncbi:uncharacterized protein LOC115391865 isoform X2 [Salarias fasciatus]|uniref:THAP domain-containing protein 1 n=1 Tax=Salarias fasciatus TaxID=181472 RepID=A0A672I1Y6_SALFA|nr:uncharacterized protein LOC115391865 isoform X2 [Salarias fasciatus]